MRNLDHFRAKGKARPQRDRLKTPQPSGRGDNASLTMPGLFPAGAMKQNKPGSEPVIHAKPALLL